MSVGELSDESTLGQVDQRLISDAVQAITESRAIIDQAKGMLMFLYGIDDDEAFELLRRQSQHHNIKLRMIAEQVTKDLVELSRSKAPSHQRDSHNLLLTAHHRIRDVAGRQLDGESKTRVPMKEIQAS